MDFLLLRHRIQHLGSNNTPAIYRLNIIAFLLVPRITMALSPTRASVENEGANIHFWYQGKGPLLILIPGGGGHGRQYNNILPFLDKHFTVVAYDRRQMSASKVAEPKPLNPAQSARDVIAIARHLGQEKTSIFANSGGGVIALQFAVSYPEALEHVICHETPTTILLPDATYYLNWCFELLEVYRTHGRKAATMEFTTALKGYADGEALNVTEPQNAELFWKFEFMQFTIYCPDLRKIVENKVSIAVAAGRTSEDAFYARTTFPQSEILGCPRIMMPGHHSGFDAQPEEFATSLIDTLDMLAKRKAKA